MSFKISCSNPDCGAPFLVPEHLAGKRIRCRKCGQIIDIPRVSSAKSDNSYGLAVQENEIVAAPFVPAGPGWCPSCNGRLAAKAVVCIECGFNLQTGEKLSTVRERKATVVIWPSAALGLSVACYIGGAILVIIALVVHPILAFFAALPAIGISLMGFFLWKTTFSRVTVARRAPHEIVCNMVHCVFGHPWKKRCYLITAEDRLFMCHDTQPQLVMTFLFLLLIGIIPGVIWWRVLLAERTFLQVRNTLTDDVQSFPLFWSEKELRYLIDTIREVEHVPVERG